MSSCRLCFSEETETRRYPGQNELGFDEIVVCRNCGFGWAEPLKSQEELDQFYSKGAYWESSQASKELVNHYMNQSRKRLKKVLPFVSKDRTIEILDYGAGHGCIADQCAQVLPNTNYSFFEPDPVMARNIMDKHLSINVSQINQVEDSKYDVIFLNHVLEHVADPINFLKQKIKGLKAGGVLYVETPRHDFLFKDNVFPHTLFFNEKSFQKIAEQLDLYVLNVKSFGSALSFKKANYLEKVLRKLLTSLYKLAILMKFTKLSFFVNSLLFRYDHPSDRIWVMGLMRRERDSLKH
ncbi:MAG: class I SAM-dependent methyltransferase [Bdellovibrionales bacterium]|nr:class I SAM-dependent methyltransferase [Bdellovibrionales bacterium]